MRCPFYIEINKGSRVLDAITEPHVQESTAAADAWEVTLTGATILLVPVADINKGSKKRRVYSVIVTKGDQRYAWRYLKNSPTITGPYTKHKAPKDIAYEFSKRHEDKAPRTPLVLAGESLDDVDAADYIEGAEDKDDKITRRDPHSKDNHQKKL